MTSRTLRIDGQKFHIVPEDEYRTLRAAMRSQQQLARQDIADLTQAERRLKDPRRKTIPLARLKAKLGL